jgi:hypothetical protein
MVEAKYFPLGISGLIEIAGCYLNIEDSTTFSCYTLIGTVPFWLEKQYGSQM